MLALNPTFSIVIPTYNRAALLSRAIRSVLWQTLDDYELLVVDDMSVDDTQLIVQSFDDPHIRYIRRPANGGAAASRNTGIEESLGQYVAFLDDDDEYLPGFLAAMQQALSATSKGVGLAWSGIKTVQDETAGEVEIGEFVWEPTFASREEAYRSFLRSRRIGTNCGIVVRKSCLAAVGLFDERMRKAEDTDFLTRMVRYCDFVVVPEMLVKVHLHSGDRLTVYDKHMAEAYERIIEKNMETLLAYPHLWTALHYKTGWIYFHSGDKSMGRTYMRRALSRSPMSIKTLLGWGLHEVSGSWAAQVHRRTSRMIKSMRTAR